MFLTFGLNDGIFCKILSITENIVMHLNNVMLCSRSMSQVTDIIKEYYDKVKITTILSIIIKNILQRKVDLRTSIFDPKRTPISLS